MRKGMAIPSIYNYVGGEIIIVVVIHKHTELLEGQRSIINKVVPMCMLTIPKVNKIRRDSRVGAPSRKLVSNTNRLKIYRYTY